jgi:hypothetical protein
MTDLTELLNNPEEHYPGNFDTPQRANALLTGLCQDAANEIAKLQVELTRLKASIALDKKAENARELGLDYETPPVQEPIGYFTVNGYDMWEQIDDTSGKPLYEHPVAQTAVQEKCFLCGERVDSCASDVCPKSAQPAVQEGRDWSLLEATQESLREHMAEIKRLKAAQPAPVQEPVAEVKAKMTGGNVGIATVIHEIYSPHREPLQPGDKLYAGHRWMGWDIEQVWGERIFGIDMRFENVQDAIKFRAKLDESTPPAPQPVPVKTYHDGKPWPVAPAPDPAPIIQQLVTALEGSGTRMRSDQWYIEIEAVAAGKFYLNSKGEGL